MLWFGSLPRRNYGDRVSLMTKVGIRVIRIRINFILVGPLGLFLPIPCLLNCKAGAPRTEHYQMAVQTSFYCTVLNMNIVYANMDIIYCTRY